MILAHELIKYKDIVEKKPNDFNKLAYLANQDLTDKELKLWLEMFNALIKQHKVSYSDHNDFRHLYEKKFCPDEHKDRCYDEDCMWDWRKKGEQT